MKIYLASQFNQRDQMRKHAKELRKMGHSVTSRWLRERGNPNGSIKQVTPKFCRETAIKDFEDIDRADAILFFSVDPDFPTRRGGRHVEFGYAIARKKRLLVVGPKENIFHYIPQVETFETWDACVRSLQIGKRRAA